MRSVIVRVSLALALAAPAAAQDRPQERRSLGADSLFGPGLVDLSANGSAVKLRLTRPGHVVAFAVGEPAVAHLVLPRRAETRVSRAGDQWIDLPWAVTSGPGGRGVTFSVGRVEVTRGQVGPGGVPLVIPPTSAPPAGAVPTGATPRPGGTVTLVIVADSAWSRDAIMALLPPQVHVSPMAMAQSIALALIGSRADTCAAYLVRW